MVFRLGRRCLDGARPRRLELDHSRPLPRHHRDPVGIGPLRPPANRVTVVPRKGTRVIQLEAPRPRPVEAPAPETETMHQLLPDSTAARLAEVDRPFAHLLEIREEGWVGRLYARPELHRVVPLGVAVWLAGLRGRLEWRLPGSTRTGALQRAAGMLGPGPPPREVRRLARQHLIELAIQTELSWRPWDARRMPLHGAENLDLARGGGRGAILATIHMGPMLNLA